MKSPNEKIEYHAKRLGIELLDKYEHFDKKMRFIVQIGEYKGLTGKIDSTGLYRIKRVSYNSLTVTSKERYWTELARRKNCVILEHDTQFRIHEPLRIRDNKGMLVTTTLSNLKRYRTHYQGLPVGEHIIISLLMSNNIPYSYQKAINTEVGTQLIDIVAHTETGDIAIEYNGVHHYTELAHTSKSLDEQKVYDNAKSAYCARMQIPLISIPYTATTIEDVAEYLKKVIMLKVIPSSLVLISPRDKQIIADYIESNLPRKTVADKYGICEATVGNIAKKYGFIRRATNPRSVQLREKEWDILYDYIYLGLSRSAVAKKHQICVASVTNIVKKNGYIKNSVGKVYPYYEHI